MWPMTDAEAVLFVNGGAGGGVIRASAALCSCQSPTGQPQRQLASRTDVTVDEVLQH